MVPGERVILGGGIRGGTRGRTRVDTWGGTRSRTSGGTSSVQVVFKYSPISLRVVSK